MIKSGGDYRVSSFFHSCALCIAAKRISTMQHIFICTELGTTGHIGLVLRLNMKWGGVSVIHMMRVESIWLMHMSGVAFPWQLSSDMFVYKNRCLFDAVKPTRKSLDYL